MKYINVLLALLWCILIFCLSHQDASLSSETSSSFTDGMIYIVENVTNSEIDNEGIIENSMNLIRKSAHFFIYLVLGALTINALKEYNVRRLVFYSIAFCFLYSITDEVHQLFMGGRSGQVSDVFLDTIGSTVGVIGYLMIYIKLLKKKLNY